MKKKNGFQKIIKRIPYSITSIDHQNIFAIMEKAKDFEKKIDKKVKQLEHQNINISTCPEYLENMIDEHSAYLLSKLEIEHIKSMHTIGYLFRKRASDRMELTELLNRIETQISNTKVKYEHLLKLAEEMNPLSDGRLEAEKRTESKEDELNE